MFKFVKNNWQLAYVSLVSLFLELLIIRLISTEIRIFAYLSNLVLLGAFIGLGFGMIVKRNYSIVLTVISLFMVVVATSANYIVRFPNLEFKFFSGITELLAPLSESYIWLQTNTYSKSGIIIGLFLLLLLFINIVLIFMPIGQRLGQLLSKNNKPILAYSINIVASLIGLWSFQTFSLFRFSPYLGIVIVVAAFFLLAKNTQEKYLIVAVLIATIAFVTPKTQPEKYSATYWSPYQKLTISPAVKDSSEIKPQPEGWYLEVNNVGYMGLLNLTTPYREKAKKELEDLYGDKNPVNLEFSDSYSLPFKFKPLAQNVLIIGAGAGNDAAAAVREGQTLIGPKGEIPADYENRIPKIDAVEIDPTIIEIGKKYHYEKPYQEKNVNAVVDDGRAYLEKTDKKYDLVIMGLADSHTLSSSLTNLRLDHYLYTEESFSRIKNVLKDDGVLFLTFEVTRPWIGDRLTKGLTDVFSQEPKVFEVRSGGVYGWGGYSFVVSKNPQTLTDILKNNQPLASYVDNNKKVFQTDTKPLTDDWPYLYLDKPRLPAISLIIAGIFAIALITLRKYLLGESNLNLPMFFWGAAFLLFEFQNVSKASLLFGVTWQTNLFIISGILILLLLANLTVAKKLLPVKSAFVLLIVSIIVQIIIPLHILNTLNYWQKVIFASLVLNLPLYFGGIIFTSMFAKAKDKANAFGSNFIGAVFGGLIEMFSFLFGIHSLLYFISVLYISGYLLSKSPKISLLKSLRI